MTDVTTEERAEQVAKQLEEEHAYGFPELRPMIAQAIRDAVAEMGVLAPGDAYVQGYRDAVGEAGRWIPVGERLPELNVPVLGFVVKATGYVGFSAENEVMKVVWKQYENDAQPLWYVADVDYYDIKAEVTYWRELPTSPQEADA